MARMGQQCKGCYSNKRDNITHIKIKNKCYQVFRRICVRRGRRGENEGVIGVCWMNPTEREY